MIPAKVQMVAADRALVGGPNEDVGGVSWTSKVGCGASTDLRPLILNLKQQGILSLSGIARGLNAPLFQLLAAANSGPLLRLRACWNVARSEGVKRSAARGDELSLLIGQSPRGFFQISDFKEAE
jgi:hypothetical protein